MMRRLLGHIVVLLAVLGTSAPTALEAQETARWYIGTYTRDLLVWDEASEEIVDRIEMRSRVSCWDARFIYVEQSLWKQNGDCASHALLRTAVATVEATP